MLYQLMDDINNTDNNNNNKQRYKINEMQVKVGSNNDDDHGRGLNPYSWLGTSTNGTYYLLPSASRSGPTTAVIRLNMLVSLRLLGCV